MWAGEGGRRGREEASHLQDVSSALSHNHVLEDIWSISCPLSYRDRLLDSGGEGFALVFYIFSETSGLPDFQSQCIDKRANERQVIIKKIEYKYNIIKYTSRCGNIFG